MNPISTVFFGTHKFAERILQSLIENEEFDVSLVITQPDRPVGRKKIITPPPVKVLAEAHGIVVMQPETLRGFDLPREFDIGIVTQYGLLIPERILYAPKYRTLNVHTSLLPKYRGASPIQSAIMAGEITTGVTLMQMDKGLDTGPILVNSGIYIPPDMTYPELEEELTELAIWLVNTLVPEYVDGEWLPTIQDDRKATHTQILTRDDGRVRWRRNTKKIYDQYRALTPWPGIWTILDGKRLKLLKISPSDKVVTPGTLTTENGNIYIGTSDRSVQVHELQLEGGRPLTPSEFIAGHRDTPYTLTI
jgi:methionyl-tRNA formyltransferase